MGRHGGGGVKNSKKSADILYGRPLGESVAGNDAWASKQDQQGHHCTALEAAWWSAAKAAPPFITWGVA